MFQLQQTTSFEQIVKKSRFLATAIPVAGEQQARAAIAAHSCADANHNCWAWRIGQSYRFSDDGEPGGTAGKPILAAIDGQSLDNCAVVVTRWFGGVLLGTGGLIRAYGGTAAACLRSAVLVPVVAMTAGKLALQFSDIALVKARLAAFEGVCITSETFTGDGAVMALDIPLSEADKVARLISDLTGGRVQVDFGN